MNKYNGRSLVPYSIILAANKGDPEAIKVVVRHYESYITKLSMMKLYNELRNSYWGVDDDMRDRLRAKLMQAILVFKIR